MYGLRTPSFRVGAASHARTGEAAGRRQAAGQLGGVPLRPIRPASLSGRRPGLVPPRGADGCDAPVIFSAFLQPRGSMLSSSLVVVCLGQFERDKAAIARRWPGGFANS